MKRLNFKELNEQTIDVAMNLTKHGNFKDQQQRFDAMEQWLSDNNIKALVGVVYATFYREEDAFAFKMRWH